MLSIDARFSLRRGQGKPYSLSSKPRLQAEKESNNVGENAGCGGGSCEVAGRCSYVIRVSKGRGVAVVVVR